MGRKKKELNDEPFIKREDVMKLTGLGRDFIIKATQNQGFPAYKLSYRVVRYRLSEVNQWLAQRKVS